MPSESNVDVSKRRAARSAVEIRFQQRRSVNSSITAIDTAILSSVARIFSSVPRDEVLCKMLLEVCRSNRQ